MPRTTVAIATNSTPDQTRNQHPDGEGRMLFSIGIHELRAARLFMDYYSGTTPGLVLSACSLNAHMVAHDRNGVYIQRLRPIQIRSWDGQDTVVVVPIKLIDMALAYEAQLRENCDFVNEVAALAAAPTTRVH